MKVGVLILNSLSIAPSAFSPHMDIARPVSSSVSSISFSFLSAEDVRRISVKQIVNPVLLDNLGQPNIGGLYDPALGPIKSREM